jgi:hypothetical protein
MTRRFALSGLVALVLAMSATVGDAVAQSSFAAPGTSVRARTRSFLYNRPTVSPYLNLTTQNPSSGLSNYFTMVRPQVEAREEAMARQRQATQMQAQLDQVQNQVRENQQQAGTVLTGQMGWSSRGYPRFGSHLNFYPGFMRIPRN